MTHCVCKNEVVSNATLCITYKKWVHKGCNGVKGGLYNASPLFVCNSCKAPVNGVMMLWWTANCVQHDAQMDYYGTKLATCSSDRSVKIFDIRGDQQVLVADLKGSVCSVYLHITATTLTTIVQLFSSMTTWVVCYWNSQTC